MSRILVADDQSSIIELFEIMLAEEGYDVLTAKSAEEAISIIKGQSIDLVITDISMPKAGGMEVLSRSMEIDREVPVIMMTAFVSTDNVIEAMKNGAYYYITKPFKVEEVKILIQKALEQRTDRMELTRLKEEVADQYSLGDLFGRNYKMVELFKMIKKVASSRSNILIRGESGTGKELVAKAICHFSDRASKPFYSINCGAMPEGLLETELFGHKKGAFTGAYNDKKGLLELSDKGTFFLDEVGDAPLSVQVKLLRVLQEREFKRVGGTKDISVDVRFIAATNQNLNQKIEDGLFREDFYYRLNIISLSIPPLRERTEDIPLLASRFVERYAKENMKNISSISSEAMSLLEGHYWKGNVRELENVIERAVVLTNKEFIDVDALPSSIVNESTKLNIAKSIDTNQSDSIDFDEVVRDVEKKLMIDALRKSSGVKKDAAQLLNITFRSFRYKYRKYGLEKVIGELDDNQNA
ncbi:MAG: sigma-54-dependent transcriptional regulator [Nitrospinota bacterium]